MYNGDIGNVGSTPSNNIAWNKQLAAELDAADGKADGKIDASIWNGFMNKTGSNGNRIKKFINLSNAEKSFNYYDKKKDAGKVDWKNWNTMLNDFKAEKSGNKETVQKAPEPEVQEETKPQAEAPKPEVQEETKPQAEAPKPEAQEETKPQAEAPKPEVQEETKPQAEAPKPEAQEETKPQAEAPKPEVQEETKPQAEAPKPEVQGETKPQAEAPKPEQNSNVKNSNKAKDTPAADTRRKAPAQKVGEINGKFDEKIKQGDTGDCYDITAVNSILAKQGGKEFLESKIKVNQATDTATVNYAGRNIEIKLTDAKNAHYLDQRGGDMRLYELAENNDRQYNRSAKMDGNGTTLEGGFTADIYKKMGLKNVKQEIIPEGKKYNFNQFNNPNRAFQYQSATYTDMRDGSLISAGVPTAHKANGQTAKLQEEHAYTVLGYKNGMVMLHDPNLTFDPNNPIGPNTLYVPENEMRKYAFALASGSIA